MSEPTTMYILLHSPGPAVPEGTSVADHPGMVEHYAFLQRRAAAGELVAAGPMPASNGHGMTLLEVDSLEEAKRLATVDDLAVARGVLTVRVSPWLVVMARD
ncbi:YciI family protein [Jatrophihabitans sp.]|uniref:YciI family protein n=1 Tax=Jatrophihabitans sp. TaxID=1932789 RepID=UPI0030C6EE27|nr:hypothetical protein [Jatrophihabitans sp.]